MTDYGSSLYLSDCKKQYDPSGPKFKIGLWLFISDESHRFVKYFSQHEIRNIIAEKCQAFYSNWYIIVIRDIFIINTCGITKFEVVFEYLPQIKNIDLARMEYWIDSLCTNYEKNYSR